MGGRVLLQDLILGVARRAEISEQEAETFVRTVFAVISDTLGDEKIVKIRNLGTFKLVEVDDRETVDAATGVTMRIKGYRKIVFTPDNNLKDLINKPFAQFETVVLNEGTNTADMERGAEPQPGEEEEPDDMNEEIPNEDVEMSGRVDTDTDEVLEKDTSSSGISVPDSSNPEVSVDLQKPLVEDETQVDQREIPATETPEKDELPDEDSVASEDMERAESLSDESHMEVSSDAAVSDIPTESDQKNAEYTSEENSRAEDTGKQAEEEISAASIEYQHADYQKVQDQKVDELNVTTQNVEHQTIEHQSIVHQGRTENERTGGCLRLTQGGMIALFAFILLLMAGSYLAGYYRVLLPASHVTSGKASQSASVEQRDSAVVAVQPKQTVAKKTADTVTAVRSEDAKAVSRPVISDVKAKQAEIKKNAADSLKQLKANAAKYPQVKNGTYLIVGVKSVHQLKSGESLLRLAQKVYGSQDFVKYIIVMNKIKDPDLVQIGTEIKLPQLIKSGDKL